MKILKYLAIMAAAMVATATYAQTANTVATTLAAAAKTSLKITVDTNADDTRDSVASKLATAINAKFGEGTVEAKSAIATLMTLKAKLPEKLKVGKASLTMNLNKAEDGSVSVDAKLVHEEGTVLSNTTSSFDPISGSLVTKGTVSEIAPGGEKVDSDASVVTDAEGNITGSVGSTIVAESASDKGDSELIAEKTSTTSETSPDNSQTVSADL